VRDAHRRVEPVLDPVDADPSHQVACLLDSGTRKRLWGELQAGVKPGQARKDVIDDLGRPEAGRPSPDAGLDAPRR
jgi:hypothetical protein